MAARPSAPLCDEKPTRPRGRDERAERGVQAHGGIGVQRCRCSSGRSAACRRRGRCAAARPAARARRRPSRRSRPRSPPAPARPCAPHCSATASTRAAGTTITARSTGPGIVLDAGVGRHALHDRRRGVDRIDRPVEARRRAGCGTARRRRCRARARRRSPPPSAAARSACRALHGGELLAPLEALDGPPR